ncbi:MAG: hypothetical protein ETSY1_44755 [Candidatus Entotheonella factor]|uniref:Orc1-like AAA ATPase domain-containing protein n=1 Tax=Entotheonella factor TaxID=1429438 RepID=W4L3E1_ENTF1|nr:MAG: hypothetical protein ETSY1_44755 [Candidatus Entotheonella factor]
MKKLPESSRQVLIGRADQLNQLNQYIQEIYKSEPRIWLIQGEAGIGKTHLLKEIQSVAVTHGLQVYKGRCIEDLALPYLPFMESLFPHLEQSCDDAEALYEDDLAMIRHLRRGRPVSTPATPEQVQQDKLRLFLSVSRATISLAQQSPALLMLDDLHWADQPSLDLFAYLAFALADQGSAPLLILGTHRPIEPEHPLARLINRFERESIYRSVILPGRV